MTTKANYKTWARERCEAWNWNCNTADIAKELIDDGDCEPDSPKWEVLAKEFKEFFPESGERDWETITNIVEVFG